MAAVGYEAEEKAQALAEMDLLDQGNLDIMIASLAAQVRGSSARSRGRGHALCARCAACLATTQEGGVIVRTLHATRAVCGVLSAVVLPVDATSCAA